ncbi:hypothetical protein [Streptomyces sp. CT34]|uniref:hypothetical protein n=1 Tax=Streptomyces sp. CT34 TaxID=1553907 RepID=UPI0005BE899A|nr:hypothetical protein [Streptomyces sp. CT34]
MVALALRGGAAGRFPLPRAGVVVAAESPRCPPGTGAAPAGSGHRPFPVPCYRPITDQDRTALMAS